MYSGSLYHHSLMQPDLGYNVPTVKDLLTDLEINRMYLWNKKRTWDACPWIYEYKRKKKKKENASAGSRTQR